MKGDGGAEKTAWFRMCVCGNGVERRVSGLYLYSGGPGYPWIHLGDWEACRRRKWESGYFTTVALIPTMIKKNHTVQGNFRSLLSKNMLIYGYILFELFYVTVIQMVL